MFPARKQLVVLGAHFATHNLKRFALSKVCVKYASLSVMAPTTLDILPMMRLLLPEN